MLEREAFAARLAAAAGAGFSKAGFAGPEGLAAIEHTAFKLRFVAIPGGRFEWSGSSGSPAWAIGAAVVLIGVARVGGQQGGRAARGCLDGRPDGSADGCVFRHTQDLRLSELRAVVTIGAELHRSHAGPRSSSIE